MLSVEPEELSAQQWKSFAHHWHSYNKSSMPTQAYCFHMNEVFANQSDKDKIYPLTTGEIAEAQQADTSLKHLFNRITATGAYMRHRFSWASFKLYNFSNICQFATFDSSKCS
jgi:hypothetical protein